MADIGVAIFKIVHAKTWNERVAQIRLIPQNHGTGAHTAIYGAIARSLFSSISVITTGHSGRCWTQLQVAAGKACREGPRDTP